MTTSLTRKLALWTFFWLVTTAIATSFSFDLFNHVVANGFAILLNLLVGFKMIHANIQYIRALDELMQKIHLEAMAVTLGLSVVVGIAYSLLDTTNLISGDAEISFLVMFMGVTYLGVLFFLQRRFR